MLTLNDGRKELYQWDTGRTATVDIECDVVHFSNLKYGESLAVEVKGGKVAIPNKLLMSGEQVYCWAFVKDENGAYTKKEQTIHVARRAKPSDYVYTETEVITIQTAVKNALQEAKESGEFKGETGATGATGADGTSVTVSSVSESTADGGENIVTFSDGKTLTVKNGSKGSQGEKGDPTDVKQTTGQSTTAVMSQKATTDEIDVLKSDLTNKLPKSPTNWEPWTADEQAAARERICASKKLGIWEDIATVNITEAADAITLNLDANGNTFSLSDIICEITIPAESPVKQRSIYFGLKTSTSFTFSRIVITTNEGYISGAITYARIVSGRVICDGAISGLSNTRHQPYYNYAIFNGYGGIKAESFDSISVFTYNDAFPAGTTVTLKGART